MSGAFLHLVGLASLSGWHRPFEANTYRWGDVFAMFVGLHLVVEGIRPTHSWLRYAASMVIVVALGILALSGTPWPF